jgi:hypothetical protein
VRSSRGAAPLHGFVEQGPAFVKLGTLGGSGPGDPITVRGEQGFPCPPHSLSAEGRGCAVILESLPKIYGRGGDGALEGPGPWVAISPLGRGSGASLSAAPVLSTPI